MARNKSGGFNKLLNFIGLVDDEDTRDTYGEEYSEGGYGRQSGYSPARSRQSAARTSSYSRQTGSSRTGRLPDSGSRSRYESRYESRYDSRGASQSRSSRGYDDYQDFILFFIDSISFAAIARSAPRRTDNFARA